MVSQVLMFLELEGFQGYITVVPVIFYNRYKYQFGVSY